MSVKQLKICERGHKFYKSSDCRSCPTCEAERKPTDGFLAALSAPARRALLHEGIDTVEKLATYTEKDILALHGMGKASLPALRGALTAKRLAFRQ